VAKPARTAKIAFDLFVYLGKPLRLAPILFNVVILMAGILAPLIATTRSEPVDRFLQSRYGNKMLSKYAPSEKGVISVVS
jgi:hypothetical protein